MIEMDWNDEADEFDQLADFRETYGFEWPNCATPDCEHKRCCWSGTDFCHPCAVRVLGRPEVDRRYRATHDAGGGLLVDPLPPPAR
jgi:hypothetical protein